MKTSANQRIFSTLAAVAALTGAQAQQTVQVHLDAHQGPWLVKEGINNHMPFGIGDQSNPLVVSVADGIRFQPGDQITISYVSGLIHPSGLAPAFDANGDPSTPTNALTDFPSQYVDSGSYPVNKGALIACFTDVFGYLSGEPFKVGNGATLIVPSGGIRLQLGLNDNAFFDNLGSLTLNVSGVPAVGVISGKAGLQGIEEQSGFDAQILLYSRTTGEVLHEEWCLLDTDGNFVISNPLPDGDYDISLKSSHWLRQRISLTISGGKVWGLQFSPTNGDVDGDNEITLSDYSVLANAFDSQPDSPNFDQNADLNGDWEINLADYAILASAFGRVGDD